MNLLLLRENDYIAESRVRITGRRHLQLRDVIKAQPGKVCRAGLLNGLAGSATVLSVDRTESVLELELSAPPPPKLDVVLLAALPRPKSFRKVLHTAVAMGVPELWFFECYKVDKSYWTSPLISPESVHEELLLALEQAGDTVLPQVHFKRRFKPFAEDELPGIIAGRVALAGHPAATETLPCGLAEPAALLVGPEGGFTDYEISLLAKQGAKPVSMGPRILRTEFAVTALLAQLGGGR